MGRNINVGLSSIGVISLAEVNRFFRSTSTLIKSTSIAFLLGFIFSALGFMINSGIKDQEKVPPRMTIPTYNLALIPSNLQEHLNNKGFQLKAETRLPESSENKSAISILMLPSISQSKELSIEVQFNSENKYLTAQVNRLWSAISEYQVTQGGTQITYNDSSNSKQFFGLFVDMSLVISFILILALNAAPASIDQVFGEKERKTLESLMLAPVTFTCLLIGKALGILSISFYTLFILFLGGVIALLLFQASISAEQLRQIFYILGIAISFFILAIFMLLLNTFLSPSARYAQIINFGIFNFLSLCLFAPALGFQYLSEEIFIKLIPIYSHSMLLKTATQNGDTLWLELMLCYLGTFLGCALCLLILRKTVTREKILYN